MDARPDWTAGSLQDVLRSRAEIKLAKRAGSISRHKYRINASATFQFEYRACEIVASSSNLLTPRPSSVVRSKDSSLSFNPEFLVPSKSRTTAWTWRTVTSEPKQRPSIEAWRTARAQGSEKSTGKRMFAMRKAPGLIAEHTSTASTSKGPI